MPDFYGTEDGFDAYVEERGLTVAEGDVAQALFRASAWIDANWGAQFSGYKTGGRDQLRAWPRTGATYYAGGNVYESIDEDETPKEVEHATYEAVIQELSSPGSLLPVVSPSKAIKKVSVEGAVSVEYANTGTLDSMPVLTSVSGILYPLISASIDYRSGLFGTAFRV